MRPAISVIIPTLNERAFIRSTVAAARRRYALSKVEIAAPLGRADQLNRGVAESRGRLVVFCHADTHLPAGWAEAVDRAIRRPRISGGAFQPVFHPPRGLLRLLNLPPPLRYPAHWAFMYGDQVQFTDRGTFERLGGFRPLPLLEDLDLARALAREGRLARLSLRVVTSSRRFLQTGPLRQQVLNVGLVLSHIVLGRTPARLADVYARTDPANHR
jgi:glycosyltransferase involved in cell wall biosynthesis